MISLSFSSGWTASGEQSRGIGVEVGVNVGDGVVVSVRAGVSVGGMLVAVDGKAVGTGVGVAEQEALKTRHKPNKT